MNAPNPLPRPCEVVALPSDSNGTFDTKAMANFFTNGWELVGIQSGAQGCTSWAYFRRWKA